MTTFETLGLSQPTLRALAARGYTIPTPVQAAAVPLLLQGEDVVAQAQTGTGKTLAFGLPLLEQVKGRGIEALILAPTRELAKQIADEINATAPRDSRVRAFAVYGGVGFGNQVGALRRGDVTVLVACPGRLLDLLARRDVHLQNVRFLVLDEADRMLDMGFVRDVEKILAMVPKDRQTALFSATLPPEVRKLAERHLRSPETVAIEPKKLTTELTEQFRVDTPTDKLPYLLGLLAAEKPQRAVVFTRTKHGAKRLGRKLVQAGHKADALHGNLGQGARERVLAAFKDGALQVLVATDVAARGIDVEGLDVVVNYDVPNVAETYVHRIGRTGRAGNTGRAFLMVGPGEAGDVRDIERLPGVKMTRFDVTPVAPPVVFEHARPHNGNRPGVRAQRDDRGWDGGAPRDRRDDRAAPRPARPQGGGFGRPAHGGFGGRPQGQGRPPQGGRPPQRRSDERHGQRPAKGQGPRRFDRRS